MFGVAGLFDVASSPKLPKHNSDFGLTLGHYGVPAGPYVVLPLLGPSTVRDTAGSVGRLFRQPVTLCSIRTGPQLGAVRRELVNTRANLLGASDVLADAALDKYSFVRNAYLQRRQYLFRAADNRRAGLRRQQRTAAEVRRRGQRRGSTARRPASAATAAPAAVGMRRSGKRLPARGCSRDAEPGADLECRPDQMVPPRIPSIPVVQAALNACRHDDPVT